MIEIHPAIRSSAMVRNKEHVSEWEHIVEVCTRGGGLTTFRIVVSLYHDHEMGMIDECQGDVLANACAASLWDIYEAVQELKKIYEEKIGYPMRDYVMKMVQLPPKPEVVWDKTPLINLALDSMDEDWFHSLHMRNKTNK